jgi:predicted alpha/beta superfamily hydrolase
MGTIEIVPDFYSPPEGVVRTLRIYRPDAWRRSRTRRFPVLYLQDGQNVFAHPESALAETWAANLAMDELIRRGEIEPHVIVAVDHRGVHRLSDYSPWDEPREEVVARGPLYAEFFVRHLMPTAQRHLRLREGPESTAVMGSSLGGLISLFLGWRHPELFGRVGGLSPSVMWAGGELARRWTERSPLPQRIYLDAGATEKFRIPGMVMDYGGATRQFHRHLQRLGYRRDQLRCVLEKGGRHSEVDWRRRLPAALRWLLT